jgi:hypothetical protein
MWEVNRSALIVTAKHPFLEWVQAGDATSNDLTLSEINREPVIYLIPECESDEEFSEWLVDNFDEIFQEQLAGWWTDEKSWPKKRSLELFHEWFEWRLHSVVLDCGDEPLSEVE